MSLPCDHYIHISDVIAVIPNHLSKPKPVSVSFHRNWPSFPFVKLKTGLQSFSVISDSLAVWFSVQLNCRVPIWCGVADKCIAQNRLRCAAEFVAMDRVRTTSRFLVTPISLLVGVWLGVLLSWLTVNIGCDWRVLSRRVLWLVKWCLRGFEVSDKYREQRHF